MLSQTVESVEWPYKKLVFVTMLCIAYAAAGVAVLYPFYMYTMG
jgi:hypothetical protein